MLFCLELSSCSESGTESGSVQLDLGVLELLPKAGLMLVEGGLLG